MVRVHAVQLIVEWNVSPIGRRAVPTIVASTEPMNSAMPTTKNMTRREASALPAMLLVAPQPRSKVNFALPHSIVNRIRATEWANDGICSITGGTFYASVAYPSFGHGCHGWEPTVHLMG